MNPAKAAAPAASHRTNVTTTTAEIAHRVGVIDNRPDGCERREALGCQNKSEHGVVNGRLLGRPIVWNHQHTQILP